MSWLRQGAKVSAKATGEARPKIEKSAKIVSFYTEAGVLMGNPL